MSDSYNEAVDKFKEWCDKNGGDIGNAADDIRLCVLEGEVAWDGGGGYSPGPNSQIVSMSVLDYDKEGIDEFGIRVESGAGEGTSHQFGTEAESILRGGTWTVDELVVSDDRLGLKKDGEGVGDVFFYK